jgi:hypothetical protein
LDEIYRALNVGPQPDEYQHRMMSAESPAIRAPLALRLTVMIVVLMAAGALLAFKRRQWKGADAPVAVSNRPPAPTPLSKQPAAVPASGRDDRVVACGQENQPDCPLQGWMDQRINTAFTTRNARELAAAFRFLSRIAPAGYADWAGWAEGGAAAATKSDFSLVKRACAGCHNDYRERYRSEMRSRVLPVEETSAGRGP